MDVAQFRRDYPDLFFLSPDEPAAVASYLQRQGVLDPGETLVACTRAGEGNMNCTVRVQTSRRSVILKQSRPWVEKYPQFAAPWDRALREAEFYQRVAAHPRVAARMPQLLAVDPLARVLVLEDLGPSRDYSSLYRGDVLAPAVVGELADFLQALHDLSPAGGAGHELVNWDMRVLNGQHVFFLPLDASLGPPLTGLASELQSIAATLRGEDALRARCEALAQSLYFSDGSSLLHGDFFPGSLLQTPQGTRVIDPEFGFYGPPEYDAGVFLGHLLLADQPATLRRHWFDAMTRGGTLRIDWLLSMAGIEVIRRLLGYAQLPLQTSLPQRVDLLQTARRLVLEPDVALI